MMQKEDTPQTTRRSALNSNIFVTTLPITKEFVFPSAVPKLLIRLQYRLLQRLLIVPPSQLFVHWCLSTQTEGTETNKRTVLEISN